MRDLIGRLYALYFFIRSAGRVRGKSFIFRHPSLLRVQKGGVMHVGRGVMIEKGARIVVRDRLHIGDKAYIGKNSTIIAFQAVSIGRGTLLGENVSVHSEDHGPAGAREEFVTAPVDIGEDVWVCAGVVITKGSKIGERTTIAANAVVNSSIPADSLAGGLPARVLRATNDPAREAMQADVM